jgi:hypothetical protein
MRRPDWREAAQAAFLLGLAAVLALRGSALVRDPLLPSAQREKRFLHWAWREPRVAEVFADVEAVLAPGEPVMLALGAREAGDSKWWSFMASYYLTRNPVLGVKARRAARTSAPPEAAVVLITPAEPEPAAGLGFPARPDSSRRPVQVLRHGRRAGSP